VAVSLQCVEAGRNVKSVATKVLLRGEVDDVRVLVGDGAGDAARAVECVRCDVAE
jgi:hypothetical protein